MDARDKPMGREQQYEEALARRLANGSGGSALAVPAAAGQCLDSDQIAAYHRHALASEEVIVCESHLASCSRCRQILTLLVSIDESPAGEPQRQVEVAPVIPIGQTNRSAQPIRTRRPFLSPAPWLVPAFGIAAALALWLVVRPPWRLAPPETSPVLVAHVPEATETTAPAPRENSAPPADSAAESLQSRSDSLAKDTEARAVSRAKALSELPSVAPPAALDKLATADSSVSQRKDEVPSRAETDATGSAASGQVQTYRERDISPQAASTPSAPAPPQSATPSAPLAAQGELRGLRQPASSLRTLGGMANSAALAASAAKEDLAVFLQSPSDAVYWRAGVAGHIERSSDGGRTWRPQPSPVQNTWLAGSAVSGAICWLAGANGALARTTDGQTWQRVAPPPEAAEASPAGRQPDWIAVTATNSQAATITSRDLQRYATQDGGLTWRKQ